MSQKEETLSSEIKSLVSILSESNKITEKATQAAIESNKTMVNVLGSKIDDLAEAQTKTNDKMQKLIEVNIEATQRHNKLDDDVNRIEKNQKESNVKFGEYMHSNDERSVENEKAILMLDNDIKNVKVPVDRMQKIFWGVVSVILTGMALVYLGLK